MKDTSFLGFGFEPSQVQPLRVVAQTQKTSAQARIQAWLTAHPGFHAVRDISAATGIAVPLCNSAISNLCQQDRITREWPQRARGRRGEPQRYAWRTS